MSVVGGTFMTMLLGCTYGVLPLAIVAGPYWSLLLTRISRPRFADMLYRKWAVLFTLSSAAALVLLSTGLTFAWDVFVTSRNFYEQYEGGWSIPSPFPEVFGWVALGLVIFVLPLVAGGVHLDRQIRAAEVDVAEVRYLRRYLVFATAIIFVFLVATATLLAMA